MTQNEINYQFTPVPTNLVFFMDSHCYKLMAILLQKYFYWKNNNKLAEDDTFFYSLNEIDDVLNNANQKDTRLTIEALYRANLIRVESHNGKRNTTRFGINWNKIEDINNMSIQDIKDSELYIYKLPRNTQITYCVRGTNCTPSNTNCSTDCNTNCSTNCTPTINNIDNIDNKENINNKNNINNKKEKDNNLELINNLNILKEKEIIKEKEIDMNSTDMASPACNVDMSVFYKKLDECVASLLDKIEQSSTLEELEEKTCKFEKWTTTKCSHSKYLEYEEQLEKVYNRTYARIVEDITSPACNEPCLNDSILSSIFTDFFTPTASAVTTAETAPIEKSREELEKVLQDTLDNPNPDTDMAIATFQAWLKKNKTALQRHNLVADADQVLEYLQNTPKEAVLATTTVEVDELSKAVADGLKHAKKGLYEDVCFQDTQENEKDYLDMLIEEEIARIQHDNAA